LCASPTNAAASLRVDACKACRQAHDLVYDIGAPETETTDEKESHAQEAASQTGRGQEKGGELGVSLRRRLLAMRKMGLIQWSGRKLCRRKPVATLRGRKTVAELLVESRR
jgi:hypothetical protein